MSLRIHTPCTARIAADRLHFGSGSLVQALEQGYFALRIPADVDIGPGLRLSREFYLDDLPSGNLPSYRGFRVRPDVYFDRDHYQTEHILVDQANRRALFPPEVDVMSQKMCTAARLVLREILATAQVAPTHWDRATDQCSADGGVEWFAASHYRAERAVDGAPAHKDTGFVTVLYFEQPGLEAWNDGEWVDVLPVAGHFIVNFGGALELLTKRLAVKVHAVLHRVRQCRRDDKVAEDRFSFAAFLNPSPDSQAFQLTADGHQLTSCGSVEDFLREFNRATWSDRHVDFGITRGPRPGGAL